MGAPRHLSQHPGGFVLTNDRLDDLVPIEPAAMIDRQVIEWDKDDIDALRFMKVDILALGMLTCMKKGFDLMAEHKGVNLDLATIPAEDPRTYAMIRKAELPSARLPDRVPRADVAMLPHVGRGQAAGLGTPVVEVTRWSAGPDPGRPWIRPYLRRREWPARPSGHPWLRAGTGARQDPRRAPIPRTSDEGRDRLRRLHARRGRPASQEHGHLQVSPAVSSVSRQAYRRHGRQRLRAGIRRADLQAAREASAPMDFQDRTPPLLR